MSWGHPNLHFTTVYSRVSQPLTCCDHTFGKVSSLTKSSLVNLVKFGRFGEETFTKKLIYKFQ